MKVCNSYELKNPTPKEMGTLLTNLMPSIDAVLKNAREEGCGGAAVALALRRGGRDLIIAPDVARGMFFDAFFEFAQAKWGNISALENLIESYSNYWLINPADCGVFDTMPDEFPKPYKTAPWKERKTRLEAARTWFSENKHRLAWDEKKRKYYLAPK